MLKCSFFDLLIEFLIGVLYMYFFLVIRECTRLETLLFSLYQWDMVISVLVSLGASPCWLHHHIGITAWTVFLEQ